MFAVQHQYIERDSGKICTERLFADKAVQLLYTGVRENAPLLFKAITSAWGSNLLGFVNYRIPPDTVVFRRKRSLLPMGIDVSECVNGPHGLNTLRKIFERKIRYWECRPMPDDPGAIVSPADSRVITGSFCETSNLFVKNKYFNYEELLGRNKREWLRAFFEGEFAVCRLTPEKYHYNHTPVSGRVLDFYALDGEYHACNPGAVVTMVTPYSKNKRVVTIIDTDVSGGSKAGLVAMVEIVALMVGNIVQCYSGKKYDSPRQITPGMFLEKGLPKSRFLPGSSTVVLMFQKGRIRFAEDIVRNMRTQGVQSRFTRGFEIPLVETDIKVRSFIGHRVAERK